MIRSLAIHRWFVGLVLSLAPLSARGQDFERPPINYAKATPDNRVSRLIDDLAAGRTSLRREPHFGYLRALLEALDVPQSSQMLVFSKTSLQRSRIAPRTPRALYF